MLTSTDGFRKDFPDLKHLTICAEAGLWLTFATYESHTSSFSNTTMAQDFGFGHFSGVIGLLKIR